MGPDHWTRGYSPYTSVPHLTALQKAYLLQLFFFTQYTMSIYQEKRYTKRLKTQFEETESSSEPDMAGMLELSEQEFKTTMIYNDLYAKSSDR